MTNFKTRLSRSIAPRCGAKLVGAMSLMGAFCLVATVAIAQSFANVVTLETLFTRLEVVMVTIGAVVICVLVHYESLNFLTTRLRKIQIHPRPRILLLIFAILATHVVEIWIFGGAYFLLITTEGHGALVASHAIGFLDSVYFSAVCYTTLGLGDVVPVGAVRFITGTEALTGLVLITWSASFTYVEMERFWRT